MNYLLKIKDSFFEISKTFATIIVKNDLVVKSFSKNNAKIFVINSDILISFTLKKLTSSTHCYIFLFGTCVRVNKRFYEYLKKEKNQRQSRNNKPNCNLTKILTILT